MRNNLQKALVLIFFAASIVAFVFYKSKSRSTKQTDLPLSETGAMAKIIADCTKTVSTINTSQTETLKQNQSPIIFRDTSKNADVFMPTSKSAQIVDPQERNLNEELRKALLRLK